MYSEPGFPDLVLCKPPHIIFAELKADNGQLTAPQQQWIDALSSCVGSALHDVDVDAGAWIHAFVWRPGDGDLVRSALLEGRL